MTQEPKCIAQDGGLWVVDKPAGWLSHHAGPGSAPDIVTFALTEWAAPTGLAPIHRIDAATSGLVLLSCDREERGRVGRWFASGTVDKRYLALVHGRLNQKGIIRKPLKDARRGRPLEAVTRYRLRQRLGGFSYLVARPEHGRKHQIRRHMQLVGHPVVGDERYRPKRFVPVPAFPGRLWLHAWRLVLPDGRCFEAPLPQLLSEHLVALAASPAGSP